MMSSRVSIIRFIVFFQSFLNLVSAITPKKKRHFTTKKDVIVPILHDDPRLDKIRTVLETHYPSDISENWTSATSKNFFMNVLNTLIVRQGGRPGALLEHNTLLKDAFRRSVITEDSEYYPLLNDSQKSVRNLEKSTLTETECEKLLELEKKLTLAPLIKGSAAQVIEDLMREDLKGLQVYYHDTTFNPQVYYHEKEIGDHMFKNPWFGLMEPNFYYFVTMNPNLTNEAQTRADMGKLLGYQSADHEFMAYRKLERVSFSVYVVKVKDGNFISRSIPVDVEKHFEAAKTTNLLDGKAFNHWEENDRKEYFSKYDAESWLIQDSFIQLFAEVSVLDDVTELLVRKKVAETNRINMILAESKLPYVMKSVVMDFTVLDIRDDLIADEQRFRDHIGKLRKVQMWHDKWSQENEVEVIGGCTSSDDKGDEVEIGTSFEKNICGRDKKKDSSFLGAQLEVACSIGTVLATVGVFVTMVCCCSGEGKREGVTEY